MYGSCLTTVVSDLLKKRSPFLETWANILNKFSRMARNMITLLEEGSNCSIGNVFFLNNVKPNLT